MLRMAIEVGLLDKFEASIIVHFPAKGHVWTWNLAAGRDLCIKLQ
jgi:hypothetical protein